MEKNPQDPTCSDTCQTLIDMSYIDDFSDAKEEGIFIALPSG